MASCFGAELLRCSAPLSSVVLQVLSAPSRSPCSSSSISCSPAGLTGFLCPAASLSRRCYVGLPLDASSPTSSKGAPLSFVSTSWEGALAPCPPLFCQVLMPCPSLCSPSQLHRTGPHLFRDLRADWRSGLPWRGGPHDHQPHRHPDRVYERDHVRPPHHGHSHGEAPVSCRLSPFFQKGIASLAPKAQGTASVREIDKGKSLLTNLEY